MSEMRDSMRLRILLPFGVFMTLEKVNRMVVETKEGCYGIWPNRLDCTAALVPGIITYQVESEKEAYIGVDEGVLIKTGNQVSVSVRNAIGGKPLGKLREEIEKEILSLSDREKEVRLVLTKIESGFSRQFQKLLKE